jgi:hypothetical protein
MADPQVEGGTKSPHPGGMNVNVFVAESDQLNGDGEVHDPKPVCRFPFSKRYVGGVVSNANGLPERKPETKNTIEPGTRFPFASTSKMPLN